MICGRERTWWHRGNLRLPGISRLLICLVLYCFFFSFENINVVPREINISLNESVKDRTRYPEIQGFVRSMPNSERTLSVDRPLLQPCFYFFFVPKSPLMTDICKNHSSLRHYSMHACMHTSMHTHLPTYQPMYYVCAPIYINIFIKF